MLIPMVVSAGQNACPPHAMYEAFEVSEYIYIYSHQYLIDNGPQGPVWDTCRVVREDKVLHPKCINCNYVDYATELSRTPYALHHKDCGSASIPY